MFSAEAVRPGWDGVRRAWPEGMLALLAAAMFLGCLGSVELWGKREQRAAAETLDTIQRDHWLVAEIQCRPRLEKPPLPRWLTAGLMLLTGRSDEVIVRLPNALAAVGTVGLVYLLGRRMGGRSVGLASALALTSLGFFISEMRQAGNDGLLTFFTTLALFLAWRRLHGPEADGERRLPAEHLGDPRNTIGFFVALGLGFLCKGPVVLLIVALTIVPYLALTRRLRAGLKALGSGPGLVLFVVIALSWPVPVLLFDPHALRVWVLEMGQKAASAGVGRHQDRHILAFEWFWMTGPWTILATWAGLGPVLRRGRETPRELAFPWFWSIANLAVFCLWTVAKPNYFLPCLPGVALLVGWEWVRLAERARTASGRAARRILQLHWVAFFVAGAVLPVVVGQVEPPALAWALVIAVAAIGAVVLSVISFRRGQDAVSLMPLVAGLVVAVLVGYGVLAPAQNATRSHRVLATTLDRLLPPETTTVAFFHELDEGLWFYLRDRRLAPVPGSAPHYNDSFDLLQDYKERKPVALLPEARQDAQKRTLLAWLDRPESERGTSYVLIRGKFYDLFAADLAGRAQPVYREEGVVRNDLVLLRVSGSTGPVATKPASAPARR